MATSSVAGYRGLLKLSTSSTGGSLTAIAELRNFSIKYDRPELDATSHESSGFREVIAGSANWTATADYLTVQTNTTQKNAYDLLYNQTKVSGEFIPTGSSSDGYYTGSCYVTSWDLGAPHDGVTASNISIVGTGALTRSSSST